MIHTKNNDHWVVALAVIVLINITAAPSGKTPEKSRKKEYNHIVSHKNLVP